MDILRKVKDHQEEEKKLMWEGSFAAYMEILKQKPEVAQTAHPRVYQMIKSFDSTEENGRKTYDF